MILVQSSDESSMLHDSRVLSKQKVW